MRLAIKLFAIATLASTSYLSVAGANKVGGYFDIALGLGQQSADYWEESGVGFGGKIGIGYRFNVNFAIEAAYAGGTTSIDAPPGYDVDIDDHTGTFYGAVVGYYPLSEQIELLGRLGIGNSKTTSTVSGAGGSVKLKSASVTAPVFGVGLSYSPSDSNLRYNIEFTHLSKDESAENHSGNAGPNGLNLFSIGINVPF